MFNNERFISIFRQVILILLLFLLLIKGNLLITINSASFSNNNEVIKLIQFCKSCPSPELEGSIGKRIIRILLYLIRFN